MKQQLAVILCMATWCGCSKMNTSTPKTVAPLPVEVMTLGMSMDAYEHCYVGEIAPAKQIPVSRSLGGEVKALWVKSGERVSAGQAIADFDDTQARSLYDAAAATLHQAEDAYERLEKVYEGGGVSDVKWVEMQTNMEKARQQEISARKALADCHLTAPIDGVVSGLDVHVGQQVLPAQQVCSIIDMSQLQLTFSVPEQDIVSIAIGDTVSFALGALPDNHYLARICEKDILAGAISHTYGVKAVLLAASTNALPGMVAKVYACRKGTSGIVVPGSCIQTTQYGLAVWVVVNGRAERRVVSQTEFVKNGVRVGSGLEPGDVVVTAGFQKLYNGAEVEIQ